MLSLEMKEQRKREKMKEAIKKYLDENKIKYEFEDDKSEIYEFILNKEKNIYIRVTVSGDTLINYDKRILGDNYEWLKPNKLDVIKLIVDKFI